MDLLATVDPSHAEGHTHHVSAVTRLLGDTMIAIGPSPARKWAGLGMTGFTISGVLKRHNLAGASSLMAFAGTIGSLLGLVGFRRPERHLSDTLQPTLKSMGVGTVLAIASLLLERILWPKEGSTIDEA